MPLVRVEVRNEFGLGRKELYVDGAHREDPKDVLDGVAVAGLAGILRQLGDLAELSAEVFHGLQEQISVTSSRSHKLAARTQRLEAALPSLEKLVLAQTSHIHFAYPAGSEWHAHIQGAQHHFVDNDLPRFIMDCYEECRDPPRLHLLDKFDPGGLGSCHRRYSDPTFFRRVSTNIDETNSFKVKGERKAPKMKKRRSLPKNAVFAHGVSKFNQRSRLQFSSPIMSGLPSPSASMADSTFKSEAEHGVNSSNLRSRSGDLERIINHRNEMHPEELESTRSSSSRVLLHNDTGNSISVDEEKLTVTGYSLQKERQESNASVRSSISWDEKAEIVDEEEYKNEQGEAAEEAEVPSSSGLFSEKAVNHEKTDETHIPHLDNDGAKSIFCVNSSKDVDREPDNYEDALNPIKAGSEADVECQSKVEVKGRLSSVYVKEIGVATDEVTESCPSFVLSNIESDFSYCIPSIEETSLQSSNLADSDIGNEGAPCQNPKEFTYSGSLPSDPVSQRVDTGNVENIESADGCLSGSGFASGQDLPEQLVKQRESPRENPVVQFWTNGSLLGLQPSKPSDFVTSNAPNSRSGVRYVDAGISNEQSDGKLAMPTKTADCIENELRDRSIAVKVDRSYTSNDEISMVASPGNASTKLGIISRSWKNYPHADRSTSTAAMITGNAVPVTLATNIAQNKPHRVTDENFSSILGIGQKLLANSLSFHKKISSVGDEGSSPAVNSKFNMNIHDCQSTDAPGQDNSMSAFKEQFQTVFAANQRPPSPPLEHMKISFLPMNGFGTSSLRLKFPFDSNHQESRRDMFASFQLVPESTFPWQDICSNSEDGTFCRSSQYMSDDSPSHVSASESDDWESNHSFKDKDKDKEQDHHDSMQRLSSVDSVSTSQEKKGTALDRRCGSIQSRNDEDSLGSFSLHELSLDLPSFEYMNSPSVQEHNLHVDRSIPKMHDPYRSNPPPRTLLPKERNLSKPHIAEVLANELVDKMVLLETSEPDMFQHPKVSPAIPKHNSLEISEVTLKSKDYGKLSPHKGTKLNVNGLETDERGDFLHQIRTQSLNLRPTVPRPTSTPAATVDINVTALLRKANAIHQAVGSEDGDDDDTWSDNV